MRPARGTLPPFSRASARRPVVSDAVEWNVRIGLLDGRIRLYLYFWIYLFCTTCTLSWCFIEEIGRRVLVFHRRDRPPGLGVSSKRSAAGSWCFSDRTGRREGLAEQASGFGGASGLPLAALRDGRLLGRDGTSITSVDARPDGSLARRLPRQRTIRVTPVTMGRSERGCLPRQRCSQRLAPTSLGPYRARSDLQHRSLHPIATSSRTALSRFCEPGLRCALPPRAAPGGFQNRERPRPQVAFSGPAVGVIATRPPPTLLGSLPVDLSLREVSSAPAGAAQPRPSGARREPAWRAASENSNSCSGPRSGNAGWHRGQCSSTSRVVVNGSPHFRQVVVRITAYTEIRSTMFRVTRRRRRS